MNAISNISAPLGRILIAGLFIYSGIGKITGYAATQGYMEMMGVPGFILPLVILLEVIGGIAIVVGFQTRIVALFLAIFSLASAFIFHPFSDPEQQTHFLKNLAIAGGFLMIVSHGAGPFSIDASREPATTARHNNRI